MEAEHRRNEILQQLCISLPQSKKWRQQIDEMLNGRSDGPTLHIAVMVEPYMSAILAGTKTIESRFSVNRCAPYLGVRQHDIILFKRSAGPVSAISSVEAVNYYELSPAVMGRLRDDYSTQLCAIDDEFWRSRSTKQFATLIVIKDTLAVDPFPIFKRDRRGWVSYPPNDAPTRRAA